MEEKAAPPRSLSFWAGAAAALAGGALALWLVYDTLSPVLVGFGLAYAFDPLADRLEARGLPRAAAVAAIMGAVFGVAALGLALILPQLLLEAQELARGLPDHFDAALDRAHAFAASWGVALPHDRAEILQRFKAWINGATLSMLAPTGRYAARFFSGAAGMIVGLLDLIIIPVVFFYFLRDISDIRAGLLELFPQRRRSWAERHLDEADRVFSGYIRGQVLVAVILAVIYGLGLTLAGVRFGAVIGVLSGLLNIVPYVGVMTGVVLSLVMATVDGAGLSGYAAVLAVFTVAQTLEGFVITPRVVGDRVGLSSMETIIALIVGGKVGGVAGMVLAIPVAGCLKVYLKDAAAAYRGSSFYRASA